MTGTADVPEEQKDKIAPESKPLDGIDEVTVKPVSSKLGAQTETQNADFGNVESVPITWDSVVQPNSQESKIKEANFFKADVERFVHLLNDHRIISLSWQYSLNNGERQLIGRVDTFMPSHRISTPIASSTRDDTAESTTKQSRNLAASDATAESESAQRIHRALSPGASASDLSPSAGRTGKPFVPTEKRFILGSEIALAVVIAAAGATRIRAGVNKSGPRPELIPGDNTSGSNRTSEIPIEDSTVPPFSSDEKLLIETDKTLAQTSRTIKQRVVRPKTLVASTDTLVSIAEAFFYDRNVAWLIADLNKAILKETWMDDKRIVELKSRQQIELPLKEDIEQFYKTKSDHACPENLVTIVEETAMDSELLNSCLGKLLDPNRE
ncbi:hypothetical protein BH10CYA1_BH10CYA1_15090 [soil metagenome]